MPFAARANYTAVRGKLLFVVYFGSKIAIRGGGETNKASQIDNDSPAQWWMIWVIIVQCALPTSSW